MKKIEVALIYRPCKTLTKDNFFTITNNFFMVALKRNEKISVTYYPTNEVFDINEINPNTDIILLPENANTGDYCIPNEIKNIEKIDIPVLARIGDPWSIKRKDIEWNHKKYRITDYFGYQHESQFRKFYGQKFQYTTILWGLENTLYKNIKPYRGRIKDRIINSGAISSTKFLSKMVARYFRPGNPESQYKLRTMCNNLSCVDYTPTLQHEYVGDNYQKLLEKYQAAIASTSHHYTTKYFEIPAARCLTFMEVTENNFAKTLGFEDDVNAIFINENNYQSKFEEYIKDTDNPKWERIANSGREFVMNNLTNDNATEKLVELMSNRIY